MRLESGWVAAMLDCVPSRLSRDSNRGSAASYMPYAVYINTWRKRARVHRFDCAISRNRFSDPDYGYRIDADTIAKLSLLQCWYGPVVPYGVATTPSLLIASGQWAVA